MSARAIVPGASRRRSAAALAAAALAAVAVVACSGGGPAVDVDAVVTFVDRGAGNPTVAVDPRTRAAFAAWVQATDAGADVHLARAADDYAARARANDVDGDAAPHDQAPSQVAVGPDGTVYVVWQNNVHVPGRRFPASNLRFARSLDGGVTFEPAIHVNDDAREAPASHTFHDIVVTRDGAVHVSWIDGRERARAAREAEATAGGADTAGTATAAGTGIPAGSHAGHIADASVPGSEVRVARLAADARSFGESVVVARDVCPCCRTSIVSDDGGAIYVAFRTARDDIRDIAIARSDDGGRTFAGPVRVHEDGWQLDACPHAGASLAVDGTGRLHVAWYTGASDGQGLWRAVSRDGGRSFAQPVPLLVGGWVPPSQVKLATDAHGRVWAAWDDRREEQSVVRVALLTEHGHDAIDRTFDGRSPAIAAGRDVVVAWHTADGAARAATIRASSRAGRAGRAHAPPHRR
jgi:hypothetical protein